MTNIKTFHCDYAYGPLWIMLMIIGIDVKNYTLTGGINQSRLRRIILTSIGFYNCLMMVLHLTIITVHVGFFNEDITIVELSFLANIIIHILPVVVMYAIFNFRQNKMSEFLLKLNQACEEIIGVGVKNYSKSRLFVRLCLFTVVVGTVVFHAFAATDDTNDSRRPGSIDVEAMLQETNIFSKNSTFGQWFLTVEFSILCLGMGSSFVCYYTFLVYYVVTAKLILTIFFHLKQNLAAQDDLTKMKAIRHQKQMCEIIELFEKLFNEIYAIWNFAETFSIILILRAMNFEKIHSSWLLDKEASMFLANIIAAFVVKAIMAARINKQIKTSLAILYETQSNTSESEYQNTHLNTVVDFYTCIIQVDSPSLTGWRMYFISNGIVLQAIAYVVTYVLVLYSIQDNFES